ncbi:thiamine pyrophosphokinase 1 isoform X2 [Rhynchophorus ferrugineus]|uniref:thiamine pyrophosphokinase 1 isoform X2 n=1 Tax=Rhynchophorus ferrugineus TaxID=354439 RepID=UPI003FCC4745
MEKRITVDGGTKRWLKWINAHNFEDRDIAAPDLITGDMDSLPDNVLVYFQEKGSKVIKTPDQNETDYTKSLRELKKHCDMHSIKINTIFVLADTSGRFDQILANINTLFKAPSFLGEKKIYHIASNSITWLLKPGSHKIIIPENLRRDQEWCALIPIGSSCKATTTGLKWNLNNTKLSFGELVSSSNTYNGQPFVTISNDSYLVWSMGIQSIL